MYYVDEASNTNKNLYSHFDYQGWSQYFMHRGANYISGAVVLYLLIIVVFFRIVGGDRF